MEPRPGDSDDDEEDDGPKMDRRKWDKEHYAKIAAEKLKALEDGNTVEPTDKEIYREAPEHLPRVPGSERAFLQTREKRIRLDAKLGSKLVRGGRVGGCVGAACALRA
jgi:hypothetical protein